MHYMRQLFTGVAICDVCGRTWELYRLRAEEAVCACGTTLNCLDDTPDLRRSTASAD